ncbi:MAG: cupredoxin family copper-binding protein [Parcubacteria group bacterium]
MKKALIVIAAIVVIAVIGAAAYFYLAKPQVKVQGEPESSAVQEGEKKVAIENFAYSPQELTISKGETVTWTNKDSIKHNVASDSGDELYTELLGQNESYSHTFNETGEYSYHCVPHPFMKGKIIVQ